MNASFTSAHKKDHTPYALTDGGGDDHSHCPFIQIIQLKKELTIIYGSIDSIDFEVIKITHMRYMICRGQSVGGMRVCV